MEKFKAVLIYFMCAVIIIANALPISAQQAVVNSFEFEKMGQKTARSLEHAGEYEIKLDVPGEFETSGYNELIIMVDASTSQSGNFPSLKKMLDGLAAELFADDSSLHITLMGFGVGPKHAGTFGNIAQLEAFLETATQEDLLQERSATNCEVGFEFVREYIENSDKLKNAIVLYTSDGSANLDETPRDWSKWNDSSEFATLWGIPRATSYAVRVEIERIFAGGEPISATLEMFPNECEAVAEALEVHGRESDEYITAIDALYDVMMSKQNEYFTCVLQNVFEAGGLDWNEKQTAADVEKAFQVCFKAYPDLTANEYEAYMNFYYIILGNTGARLSPNRFTRAAAASAELMKNKKVVSLYHVGYSEASNNWMNPEKGYFADYDASKLKYVYSSNFAGVAENISELATELITTGYFDVTVTDPMSKWVTLDTASIRIVNNATGEVLWKYGEGWLTDVKLTEDDPITVAVNQNGYPEITWKIKDGYLLHTDRYSMRYVVNIDETAPGFVAGREYPLNDPTVVSYTDPSGTPHTESIDVPDGKEGTVHPESGYFPTSDEYHAIIIGDAIITTEHEFDEDGECILCHYEKKDEPEQTPEEEIVPDGDVVVEAPAEPMTEEVEAVVAP